MNFAAYYRRFVPALLAAGALASAFGATSAHAQAPLTLTNGASGVSVNSTSFFGGTLQGTGTATFAFTNSGGTLSGTLYSSVYRNASNTLDFYYQIALDAANNTSLDSFSLTSFSGSQLSVGQTADDIDSAGAIYTAGGFAASTASRSGNFNNGAAVTFFFNDPNTAFVSGRSGTVFLRSNATSYVTTGGSAFFSGGVAANSNGTVATVLPSGTVAANAPEPGSLALLGTGLMSLGGVMVRRSAKK